MAKAKTERRFKLFGRQFRLWQLGLIVIAVLFIGFIAYESYLDQKDSQKFDEIEYTIDTLTSRLEGEFGITGEYDNYCYEPGRKFEKSPTVCVYQKRYSLSDNNTYETVLDFVAQQSDIVSWSDSVFNDLDFVGSSEEYDCSVDENVSSSGGFTIECSDLARDNYYGFKD